VRPDRLSPQASTVSNDAWRRDSPFGRSSLRCYSGHAVNAAILRGFLASLGVALAVLLVSSPAAGSSPHRPRVLAVKFALDVSPPTADYLTGEIDHAASAGYDAVAILLDTPGGLSDSMRKIYQKELAAKIPVIVYVSPEGARAASAGVWISEAADVLAMSPVSRTSPQSTSGTRPGRSRPSRWRPT